MKAVGVGKFLDDFLGVLKPRISFHEKLRSGKCMGAWVTEIGNVNAGKGNLISQMIM